MTILSTDLEDATLAFGFNADDQTLVVKQGVFLVSDASIGAYDNKHKGDNIFNYGTIIGGTGAETDGQNATITNYEGGVISGSYLGIYSTGDHSKILNNGLITGNFGIIMTGYQTALENNGLIQSAGQAVNIDGMFETFTNAGEIDGSNYGLTVSSSTTTRIMNAGTIQGGNGAIAVDYTAGGVDFTNTGTVDGDCFFSDGGNRILNRGTIIGDLNLGNGNNTVDGRGGTVEGNIVAGSGQDKLIAGNDGETLGGGRGHDRLYGGSGADTFMFTSYAAADADMVKGFDVAHDLLQLDQTVFSHLKADVAPTFAIGAKASSATDFLFYNAGTGNLYYDVDGSKTAHAPFLVANLGTGLHLTAKDFSVV